MKLGTLLVFMICVNAGTCIKQYYMDLNCGQFLDFSTLGLHQIRLKFTSRSTYRTNTNCVLHLKTEPHERFMLYFKSVETSSCKHAWLDVFDSNDTTTPIPGLQRKCGHISLTSSVYTTRKSALTLNFVSDYYIPIVDKGFDMVITSYHTGSCYGYEHECDNGRCVDESLECNGYNPCGDHSDCPLTGGAIAGIVIGCFIFVVIVTTVLIVFRRRRRAYTRTVVTETTSYGTGGYNQPPTTAYPTVQQYPPPSGQQYPPLQYPQN